MSTHKSIRILLFVVFVLSVLLLSACGDNDPIALDPQTVVVEASGESETQEWECPSGWALRQPKKGSDIPRCQNMTLGQTGQFQPATPKQ